MTDTPQTIDWQANARLFEAECNRLKKELKRVNGFRERTGQRLRQRSDALQEAIAQREILKEQLERTQKQFRTCDVCGYVAWRDRDANTEDCQYCKAQKAIAEMRHMLNAAALRTDVDWPDDYEFGRDYVSKEQVRSLVDEISRASNISDLTQLPAVDCTIGESYLVGVQRGLIIAENIAHTHARALGL